MMNRFSLGRAVSATLILGLPIAASSQAVPTPWPSAVVDCRAGCQNDVNGCRESVMVAAVVDARPGYHLIRGTESIIARWNASDSPGLVRDPEFSYEWIPQASAQPLAVKITPKLNTCTGRSPHTQGVTFYQFRVFEQR